MTATPSAARCGLEGPPRYGRPPRASKLDAFKNEIQRLLQEDPRIPGKRIAS